MGCVGKLESIISIEIKIYLAPGFNLGMKNQCGSEGEGEGEISPNGEDV
jgi:hypothetical protein